MDKGLGFGGKMEIDHGIEKWDINTTRSNVSRDENICRFIGIFVFMPESIFYIKKRFDKY